MNTLNFLLIANLSQSDILYLQKMEHQIAKTASINILPDKQAILERTQSNIAYLESKRYNLRCKR